MPSPGSTTTGSNGETPAPTDASAQAAHPVVERLAADAHHAVDNVASVAAHTAQSLGEGRRQLQAAPTNLVEGCCTQIRNRPFASVALALAGGFLLSWLLRQR